MNDSDLPAVQSIQLNAWALTGDDVEVMSDHYKNTLTMKCEIEG